MSMANRSAHWKIASSNGRPEKSSTDSKLDISKVLAQVELKNKMRREEAFRPEYSLIELERIKAMNMWLSLQVSVGVKGTIHFIS